MARTGFVINPNWFRDYFTENSTNLLIIGDEMENYVKPFVPVKSGNLQNSVSTNVSISNQYCDISLEWNVDYAKEVDDRVNFTGALIDDSSIVNSIVTKNIGG